MSDSINTSNMLTSDIYGINAYVNEVKKKFTPGVNEDTLMLGIFGYMGQIFSDTLQNTIVMASEFSNESIPTEAKFEKNIIAHALGHGITDINAIPAYMDVMLTFVEDDIINWANARDADGNETSWTFIFDKDTPIYIGDYCFHTDYDIEIRKIKLDHTGSNGDFAYTARYLIDIENPVSDITNPYLTPPVKMKVNGMNVIYTKCLIRQVRKTTISKKILSDNSIASKTVTFNFEGQLAAFTIDVTEGKNKTHLVPVYEGLAVESRKYPYFYYTYLDSSTIRIKFDRYSYSPRINSDLDINIQTTEGEGGNFSLAPDTVLGFSCESEKYAYSNIGLEIKPVFGESSYGTNKKSIEDLKKLIPKEALSRGSITNISDLENFFNMLNTEDSMTYFYKKRDNALMRLYYSFMIVRDALNNIIPTNTIDVRVYSDQLQTEDGSKLVFKKGQVIKLLEGGYGEVYPSDSLEIDHDESFYYVIPYNFIINNSPLYGMYLLSTIDTKKFLDFTYINDKSIYQFIATSINLYRGYIDNPNRYDISINMQQNIEKVTGFSDKLDVKCIAVFYNREDVPLRWAKDSNPTYSSIGNIYSAKFSFTTEDFIDLENRIRIDTGLYDIKSTNESYAHFNGNMKCVIHVLSKQGTPSGTNILNDILPAEELEGYTLSNSYTVVEGIDFFYDYSDIITSTVIAGKDDNGKEYFTISDVPVIKHDYFSNEDKVIDFNKELIKRKTYIDYATQVLEDAFGMDFKFFNTYGPSKLFTIDNEIDYINRTNLSLTFRLKLKPSYDTNIINNIIADIKDYVEDINSIKSLHMPNLVTEITTKYREYLVFFEFVDMNGYGPSVQHIYSMGMPDALVVPEFLNIHTLDDGTPDITIITV